MADRKLLLSGGGAVCASDMKGVLLRRQRFPCSSASSEPLSSLFVSGSSSPFLGQGTMVSFVDVNEGNKSDKSFFCSFDQEGNVDEDLDEYVHQPEKKRRLTANQVQFLETSFEAENKLEPERKVELARELGLQPRQVAIWFQNRRARWKTKQLEKDYEALQASYNDLKTDYDNLLKEKDKLKAEVLHLSDKLLLKEKEGENSELLDTEKLLNASLREPIADLCSEGEVSNLSTVGYKLEDASSDKSDVFDSDSLYHVDGGHSAVLEPSDSSYAFEPDQSDTSQDEEDNLSKSLLLTGYMFPKIEDVGYTDLPAGSCYFGLPVEDHAFGFWS